MLSQLVVCLSSWNSTLKAWIEDRLTDFNRCPLRLASIEHATKTPKKLNGERMSRTRSTMIVPAIALCHGLHVH